MVYNFQPNANFHTVFAQSLSQNLPNANLTYDPTSVVATMIESFSGALAATNGTNASMLTAGANWLQNEANYYSGMASTAAANAAQTGNRIQANIASVANNMAQRMSARV